MTGKIPGFIIKVEDFELCCCVQQMKNDLVPQLPLGIKVDFPDGKAICAIFEGGNATKEKLEQFIDIVHMSAVKKELAAELEVELAGWT